MTCRVCFFELTRLNYDKVTEITRSQGVLDNFLSGLAERFYVRTLCTNVGKIFRIYYNKNLFTRLPCLSQTRAIESWLWQNLILFFFFFIFFYLIVTVIRYFYTQLISSLKRLKVIYVDAI